MTTAQQSNSSTMIIRHGTLEEIRAAWNRSALHKRELRRKCESENVQCQRTLLATLTGFFCPYSEGNPSRQSKKSATYSTYWFINGALRPRSPRGNAAKKMSVQCTRTKHSKTYRQKRLARGQQCRESSRARQPQVHPLPTPCITCTQIPYADPHRA